MLLPKDIRLFLVCQILFVGLVSSFFDDDQPFCSTRIDKCCDGRQDDCSLPRQGTLCYCDAFCRKTGGRNGDCCPDYGEVCLGEERREPINQTCYYQGQFIRRGEALRVNCNMCLCQNVTMRRMELVCGTDECIVDERLVREINGLRLDWTAGNQSMFYGYKVKEGMDRRLGTMSYRRKVATMRPHSITIQRPLPQSFDSRDRWPGMIHGPDDQGWCGASWVFSTVGVASDRWAVMSKGDFTEGLSYQHLYLCNLANQRGCDGGHITRAWKFIHKFGLLPRGCLSWGGARTCSIMRNRSAIRANCPERGGEESLKRMGPLYRIDGEEAIMQEILTNGPVQATMMVFRDFFLYKNGIYSCPSRQPRRTAMQSGFHSVKIIGWGRSRGIKYWLAVNSWGTEWGEGGYFRIVKGSNECNIESFVVAAWIHGSTRNTNPFFSYSIR